MAVLRFDLKGDPRVAIVTGAAQGLGRAHATLLTSRGARVVVHDDPDHRASLEALVDAVRAAGGQAIASTDPATLALVAREAWGRVDVLIHAPVRGATWELTLAGVSAARALSEAVWPLLHERRAGRMIFTVARADLEGALETSGLAVLGLAQSFAVRGRSAGVNVTTVATVGDGTLVPEHVAPLVAWLCHDGCDETGGLFEAGGGHVAELRWERAAGKVWKLGRALTPELMRAGWPKVTDFSASARPADLAETLATVTANAGSKSLGGNELIELDEALGHHFPERSSRYDEKDLMLYALGVGAGGAVASSPPCEGASDLQYLYENTPEGFRALPTFGVVPGLNAILDLAKSGATAPGLHYGFERILHSEQFMELTRPLPARQSLKHRARIKHVFDKGRHALVVTEVQSFDENGDLLITNAMSTTIRGAGGWGGERGPSTDEHVPPDRGPDAVIEERLGASQALLYRLSGDVNPLHADPAFAKSFGFERPILHGLCTAGFAARHVLKAFAKNDPTRFKSIRVRFSESVFPGEILVTEMWSGGPSRVLFRCKVKERDRVVLTNAAMDFRASDAG